jgi:antitoxin component YwqK of YwqJK toxin-antitoxin module
MKVTNIIPSLLLLIILLTLSFGVRAQPKIKVTPSSIQLDTFEFGNSPYFDITVHNEGDEDLIILHVKGNFICKWPQSAIEPGRSTKFSCRCPNDRKGSIRSFVYVSSNDSNNGKIRINLISYAKYKGISERPPITQSRPEEPVKTTVPTSSHADTTFNNVKYNYTQWNSVGKLLFAGNYSDSCAGPRQKCKHGVWTSYYPSGQLKSSVMMLNGEPVGWSTTYFPDGNTRNQTKYLQNGGTDSTIQYYQNGFMSREANVRPRGHSEERTYYEDGTLKTFRNFENGVRQGPYLRFYSVGPIQETGYFRNNKKDADSTRTFEQPHIVSDAIPTTGSDDCDGFRSQKRKDNKTTMTGLFLNCKLENGIEYIYGKDGNLIRIHHFKNGGIVRAQEVQKSN